MLPAWALGKLGEEAFEFQRAPTLGGECYYEQNLNASLSFFRFNGHPPLGVNATGEFQQPLGAFGLRFNGHPPLGVNATSRTPRKGGTVAAVSTGTHPWG